MFHVLCRLEISLNSLPGKIRFISLDFFYFFFPFCPFLKVKSPTRGHFSTQFRSETQRNSNFSKKTEKVRTSAKLLIFRSQHFENYGIKEWLWVLLFTNIWSFENSTFHDFFAWLFYKDFLPKFAKEINQLND